ncbi:MAG: CoA transferase [Candidatus Binatia bacterium]|nr:CoA transferase [Candidatus Binatia bacterium]
MSLPLAHIRVIDLTRARSGPTCVRQLADMGAQVIKVESPDDEEGVPRHNSDFQNLHRNKRSLVLNLKDERGRAILKQLVARADVLVENYRPEVKKRLGIDYSDLRTVNPRLIYASISGFGQTGPYKDRPGYDQIAQGMGGVMSITGPPGSGPWRVGIPVADLTAGLLAAQGILVALLERERSGEGQWVHTSLLEAMVSMLDFQATRWLIDKEVPLQAGNNHPTSIPTGTFRVQDGYINIAAGSQHMWERLCRALEAGDLCTDPRFASPSMRSKNRDALTVALEERLQTKTAAEWIEILNAAGVPCGPILTIDQVFADPQVQHLGLACPLAHPRLGHIHVLGLPVTLSRTPGAVRTPAPEKGEHTDEILAELGLSGAEIGQLRAEGVVSKPEERSG